MRSGMFEPTVDWREERDGARVSLLPTCTCACTASGSVRVYVCYHHPTDRAALPIHRAPITAAGAQAVPREKLQPAALLLRLASRVEHRTRWAPCP